MVLSNANVAKTSGNGSSSVIRKIHNMQWLKQVTDPKNSDQSRATGGAMFNALTNLKEDEPMAPERKSKRRNKRSRNPKQRGDIAKNAEITLKSNGMATRPNTRGANDPVTKDSQPFVAGGQSGVGKGIWNGDKNTVDELFPGAAEAARNEQLEEEQLQMAVAASLESAFLEKCAIDPPEEDNVEAARSSDEENIWEGVHKNLPSPTGEETAGDFDANNNSGSNKSRSSSVTMRKSDGKVSSCESSKLTETPSVAGKTDEPLAPAVVPKFIDKFGRLDGCSEKHMFMGKGARMKEADYRNKLQQQHGDSANGPNQRPRNNVGSQDPRSRNARQPAGNSRNERRERYDLTKKNPYKYIRVTDDLDKRISDKSDGEHENRTEDANRDGDEKKNQPSMSMTVDPPSVVPVQKSATESSTPIERPLVEPPREPQIKIEPGVSPKETAEFTGDPAKPQVHLKDFNSRYNTPQEQTTLQARPNPACPTDSFRSGAPIGHPCITDACCQTSGIQFPPACFSVPPPGFASLENPQKSSGNAAYVLPVDSSIGSAYVVPADSASDSFSEIEEMEAVYTRIKTYDPMLYDILMKRRQRQAVRRSAQMQAINYSTIPENCDVSPVDPMSFQGAPASYDVSAEQPSCDTLNPNAKQYSPISKQAWISHGQQDPMSCYSVPPNCDSQSAAVYCQYPGQPQDITRQDSSGWIRAGPQQFYVPVHPAQHHVHYANETIAPTAMLGRQNYLVSEQNLPYKNAQRPMNLQLNDDYTIRCQTSGFDDIPTDPQRQMQYRASHRQCGGAPSQFCSMPCEGSYGNQPAMSKFVNYVQHPPHPLHQYADFVAKNRNSMNSMNHGNVSLHNNNDAQIRGFAQPGCGAQEQISTNQRRLRFVEPIIPPMSFSDKPPVPGKGRGRGRHDNKQ